MKSLEEEYKEYEPNFHKLVHRPFWKSDRVVKWSMIERERLLMEVQDYFITLYYQFDPSYGTDFKGYFMVKLNKWAHKQAKKLLSERRHEQCYSDEFFQMQEETPPKECDTSLDPYLPLLSPRQQEVISLWHGGQYSASEISSLLGIPRQNVYTHLKKGQKKIKEYIESQE